MTIDHFDNPVSRLSNLFHEIHTYESALPSRDAWEKLLGTQDTAQIYIQIGTLMALPKEAAALARQIIPNRESLISHWEGCFNRAFAGQNINAHWGTFSKFIDVPALNYLQSHADMVAMKLNAKPLPETDLWKTRDEILSIYNDVLTSDEMDSEVREYLARALKKLITSIDEFRLTGTKPVTDAIDSIVGHAFKNPTYRSFLTNEKLGKRIFESLDAMGNLVSIVTSLPQLTSSFQTFTAFLPR